jgi:hypothetical protein
VTEAALDETGEVSAVGEYKRIFKQVLDNKPSGMRIRLAHAMGKNRSFVSQISNSTYPVPVPIQHLNTIFDVCHFPPDSRGAVARPRQCSVELALDHGMDEFANPVAQASFDRIKPVVEKAVEGAAKHLESEQMPQKLKRLSRSRSTIPVRPLRHGD